MTSDISLIVQSLPFAMLVLDPSPEFVIQHSSDMFLAASRLTREDLIGRGIFDVFPGMAGDVDGPALLRASLEQVRSTRQTQTMEVQRYDVPDRNGGNPIAKYWLPTNVPVLDADGALRFILHRVYDMTGVLSDERGVAADGAELSSSLTDLKHLVELFKEGERRRKTAEARATEAGERLDLAVMAGELGTFYCPMPMGKIFWNDKCKEHFFLPQDAEVNFDVFYDCIHPDDRERTRAAVLASIESRTTYDVEYRAQAADGRQRWLRAKGRAYYDRDGAPERFDGITIDISEPKRIETELARSNQQKDDFLAMLAHELRNPLAPIAAAADLLRLTPPDADRIARMSDVLSRQSRHMTGMLDDLLDASRVTRGMVELERTVLDCKQLIAAALEQVQPLLAARGHRLHTHISHEAALVHGDEKRVVQVLANVLINAAKYTPVNGRIDLSLRVDGDEVTITVADNGVGITPELLPRVFDLFVQGARTPDRAQGGLGLGLALVKSMLELHGGRAVIASGGDGQGTTLQLWLPRHQAPAGAGAATSLLNASRTLRVVVVDDNADAAWTLATCLRAVGHSVTELTSPRAALALTPEDTPDVFLLDIGMPDMDGNELARRLRQQPHTARVPLIAVTGYGQRDSQEAAGAHFDRYLVKPVDFKGLIRLLDEMAI